MGDSAINPGYTAIVNSGTRVIGDRLGRSEGGIAIDWTEGCPGTRLIPRLLAIIMDTPSARTDGQGMEPDPAKEE
jgi:hypothetical protein